MGITEAIAQGFRAVAEYFGWARERTLEKNREDVVKGAVASDEQRAVDKTAKAVADDDVAEIRRELAE
jgi:division protein CdvB (Snf7/Vps24/ESCRT-III family)